MTITIGWWALPALITVIAFGWAFTREGENTSYFPDVTPLLCGAVALFVSMAAWLVYALAT